MILNEIFKKAYKLYPDQTAVVCGKDHWTYREFTNRVLRLSSFLNGCGIGHQDKIAIIHPNCHYFLETYYGAAWCGAVLVPINIRLSPAEMAFIINHSEAKLLIVDPEFEKHIKAIRSEIPMVKSILWTGDGTGYDLTFDDVIASQTECPFTSCTQPVEAEDTAHIYYTSGTTGKPKGVMLSHKNVYIHALGTIAELHLTDNDIWVHVAPLFHLADAWASWAITWVGGTHIIVRAFDPKTVFATIEQEKITITNLIPTMLNLMVNHPDVGKYDYSSLRVLLSGGAPIAPEIVRKIIDTFQCDYVQTYGMTETSPYLTLSLLKNHLKDLSDEEQLRFKAKTGREFIGVELRVVDLQDKDVANDENHVGEIIVKGDTVTAGYWKTPDETAKALKDGWLYTGDLAVIDSEGYVTIVDRKKDMILTGGENVYSTEVENVLYMHPAILECAVIGVPDKKWGEAVKAIVVLKDGHTTIEKDIIEFCKDRIAHYKAPKSITFLPDLPKTGSGKIMKKELRDPYWKNYKKGIN
jgi:acyl-CoA synthetase (AMP-forming)/AMP-acid ligase II